MIYKLKKKNIMTESIKNSIEKEIEALSTDLPEGIYHKNKEFDTGFYINVMIDRKKFKIFYEDKNIPEFITFLLIVDADFPAAPPKILSKTNFCFPSLMDGRDLFDDIFKSKWNERSSLYEVIISIPSFISRVLNSKINYFYGVFHLGAVYDLKNFSNMLVNTFTCKLEKDSKLKKKINDDINITLILSDDGFVLFENMECNYGRITFWSSLYALVDIQINKVQKRACINFYSDETGEEIHLKLRIENILFFREAMVKRMNQLKILVEHNKILKGEQLEKKLTDKDIQSMKIDDLNKHIEILSKKIEQNELNYYNVRTLMNLCQKAVEYYSALNDSRFQYYLDLVKLMLSKESVSKILNSHDI